MTKPEETTQPAGAPFERPVRGPRVRTVWECSVEGHYTYKGHSIGIARDHENYNWYIRVTAPNGMRDYDGWWQNSERKPHREAVLEALRGSMLHPNAEITGLSG